MIKNAHEYEITKAAADEFERALESLKHTPLDGLSPRLRQAQREAMESQLGDLRAEMAAYDALREARTSLLDTLRRRAEWLIHRLLKHVHRHIRKRQR